MSEIASLPMYDWPELRNSNDELWACIRDCMKARNIVVPDGLATKLSGDNDWLSPNLLLGQTCGFPFANYLKGKVQYIATPVYAAEGCSGPQYSSVIVANVESGTTIGNFTEKRFVFNSTDSWSGYQVIAREYKSPADFVVIPAKSGGHRKSAQLVATGEADVAAIDAVCWHYLREFEPEACARLEVIGWTSFYPALPFITSIDTSAEVVQELRNCMCDIGSKLASRNAMQQVIIGCEVLKPASYDVFIAN